MSSKRGESRKGMKENSFHVNMRCYSDSTRSDSAECECVGDGGKSSTLHP
jgi:hypothetical protein